MFAAQVENQPKDGQWHATLQAVKPVQTLLFGGVLARTQESSWVRVELMEAYLKILGRKAFLDGEAGMHSRILGRIAAIFVNKQ